MSILNSVSRGFGFTIGNKMANSVVNSLSQSNGEYKQSPSLSGRQIFKTIMWGFVMIMLAMFIVTIFQAAVTPLNSNPDFSKIGIQTMVLALIFTYIIGRGYYNDNKKIINEVNQFNELKKEKERMIKETDESYINGKMTKREYEVLMRKLNKL